MQLGNSRWLVSGCFGVVRDGYGSPWMAIVSGGGRWYLVSATPVTIIAVGSKSRELHSLLINLKQQIINKDNSGWYVCRRVCRRVCRHDISRFQIALKSPRDFQNILEQSRIVQNGLESSRMLLNVFESSRISILMSIFSH